MLACAALDVSFGEPEQRHAGRRLAPMVARRSVFGGGQLDLTLQSVELTELIVRQPERRVGRVRETDTGASRFDDGIVPAPVCLQDL